MADGDLDKDPIPIDTAMDTEPEDEPQHESGGKLDLEEALPLPAFSKHDMSELEAELDAIMIRGCKVDACLDLFIARVLSFVSEQKDTPLAPQLSPYRFTNDLDNVPEEKLKDMEKELRENLNRLIPEYVSDNTEDVLKRAKRRLDRRVLGLEIEQMKSHKSPSDAYVKSAERATALFSCGGTISIAMGTDGARCKNRRASPPVSIFWCKKGDATAHKVVLPANGSIPGDGSFTLQRLVGDCEPASFGKGAQDIIDPDYRKAGKLNSDHFATSSHPAALGILDCAELYKLNVYSGPSGIFRKHVDTPRGASGILNVQHHGHKVTFDWSDKSDTTIQWAAFYSDCEHEIETITHGDRITLTYNLYVTEPIGGLITGSNTVIDPQTFPIYGWMKNLLSTDDFMENGGILGFGCSHAYAHSSDYANTHLPRALEGANLVLYSVLQSLGIRLSILPVLDEITSYRAGSPGGCHTNGYHLRTDPDILNPVSLSITKCENTDQRWEELYKRRSDWCYDRASESDMVKAVDDLWPSYNVAGITWVTDAWHKEPALTYIAYENEATEDTLYSSIAILAFILPAEERGDIAQQ
ncbi:hypothetical protein BJX66DRAFT_326137 [Aspergillus keveii]|uniref:Fe2OG dioxygenase domain-containing protein n=1 Tax=Aspergillus keveii TaxID=714993 RepID=A0ABR4G2V0_9EURO